MRDLIGKKVIAVHAHPDDEAIWTGGLIAELSLRGADVTVVTCTLGEQGEVIGEPYQGLVADSADQLGGFRIGELSRSLSLLGARGKHLGGAGYWRDSGMIGDKANEHPRAFISSGEEAVEQLAEILVQTNPDLVITYGPDGGYGHPDHIQAHKITHEAVRRVPVTRILWAVTDKTDLDAGLDAISAVPEAWRRPRPDEIACVENVDIRILLSDEAFARKKEAMKAHATQLWIADGSTTATNSHAAIAAVSDPNAAPAVFALSNLIAQPLLRTECYQMGQGPLPSGLDIVAELVR